MINRVDLDRARELLAMNEADNLSASRNRGGGQVAGSGRKQTLAEPPRQAERFPEEPPTKPAKERLDPRPEQKENQAAKHDLSQVQSTSK